MGNEKSISLLDEGEIVKMGVSVFEVNGVPGNSKPYISPHYIISVCHSGSIDVEYDDNPAKFTPHDLAIVYPMHTLVVHRVSSDYHATLIAVSSEFYTKFGKLFFSDKRSVYERIPHFHLADSQYDDMMSFADAIRRITRLNIKSREDITRGCLYLLSQIIDFFHDTAFATMGDATKSLSNRFYNAIIENCHLHRDVWFYARLFHLSPKYFSKVIQQQTGHNAGHWIQHFVILHAKQMLTYNADVAIQAIADRLGFSDQASFCRYFKRGTGLSPTQYRAGV